MAIADDRSQPAGNRLVGWWRRWRWRAAGLAELGLLSGEAERVARDAGVGAGELRVLAGKWPDAADLVERRLAALGLDAHAIDAAEPATMRDLQRVCTLCDNKRVCEHDLARGPANAAWQEYCPNSGTLAALTQQARGCRKTR